MELQDYWTALCRYWRTVAAVTASCLALALAVVLVTPATYEARAQVFVASTGEGTSGSQFVNQRVTSYPDIAESRSVLGPVLEELALDESLPVLRQRVEAVNPPDTSQIDVTVTDRDPVQAAEVADAVAQRFSSVVEGLERPRDGVSPVALTVTDPATVPTTPVSPVPHLLLGLGLVVGLALGVAAAVLRSSRDTRVHTVEDVRDAWGDAGLPVLQEPSRAGRRRSPGAGRPDAAVARRLEPPAEQRPVRAVVLSPAGDGRTAQAFARDVAARLADWGVPATVDAGMPGPAPAGTAAGVHLAVGSPSAPLKQWRRLAADHEGAVVVLEPGRSQAADLAEIRSVLAAAGLPVLDVVLRSGSRRPSAGASSSGNPPVPAPRPSTRSEGTGSRPLAAGRR